MPQVKREKPASTSQARCTIPIREVDSKALHCTVPESLLPEHYTKAVRVFPGDRLSELFPGEKSQKLIQLCDRLRPGQRNDIDHIVVGPHQKKQTKLKVQLRDDVTSTASTKRLMEDALSRCGY